MNQTFSSLAFGSNGKCYVGGSTGFLYTLTMTDKGPKCQNTVKGAHKGPITVVRATKDKILTTGQDGIVNVFTHDLKKLESIQTQCKAIISVDYFEPKQSIVILTKMGEIFKFSFKEGQQTFPEKGVFLLKSHYEGEVWGLEVY